MSADTAALLRAARERIAAGEHPWGALVRESRGDEYVKNRLYDEVWSQLPDGCGCIFLAHYAANHTDAEVLALFDRAIAACEAGDGE